jgi:hypothetical protein
MGLEGGVRVKLSLNDREVLDCVIAMIFDHGVDAFMDFIDDEEEEREWMENFREEWLQVAKQCHELCQLMPQNAEKYEWQRGEFVREAEARLWAKLKRHPWNLLKRDAQDTIARGWKVEVFA